MSDPTPESRKPPAPEGQSIPPRVPIPLEYETPKRPPNRRLRVLMIVLVCLVFTILLADLLPVLHPASPVSKRVMCAVNLRQIGQGILMYSAANNGIFPPRLEEVFLTQQLGAQVFICPESSDTPAPGAALQQQVAKLSAGGHLSYVYVGNGLTARTATPSTIVVFEPLKNHGGRGINVLFGDGHVEWWVTPTAQKMMAELAAGHNPPRPEMLKQE